MHKRFEVLDLFFNGVNIDNGEWVEVKERIPNQKSGVYRVKRENGNEGSAYFFDDMYAPKGIFEKIKLSYWWDKETKQPIHDVMSWRDFKEEVS